MFRKTENNDVIAIRDIPHIRWIGAGIAFFFYFFVFVLDFSYNKKNLEDWAGMIFFALLLTGVFFYMLSFPATTTRIDRKGKTISVRKQSLLKYSFDVYSFRELSDLIFVSEFYSLGNKSFQLILPLSGDRKIELSISANIYKEPLENLANEMNGYVAGSFDQTTSRPAAVIKY